MDVLGPARYGALLAAIATTGCMEVFGVEPPSVPSQGSSSLYDRHAPPVMADDGGPTRLYGALPPATPPMPPMPPIDDARLARSSHAQPPPALPGWPPPMEVRDARDVREVRGPAVVVLQVPAGSLVSVTLAPLPGAPVPGSFRASPYGDDTSPAPSLYKPSPYENPRSLYRPD